VSNITITLPGAAHPTRGKGLKMKKGWMSMRLYEHPEKHQAEVYGNVVLSPVGVYCLAVGSELLSVRQSWAAKIHKEEVDEKQSAIIIRNVPESLRRSFKARAASQGKSMQGLVLELMTRYVG